MHDSFDIVSRAIDCAAEGIRHSSKPEVTGDRLLIGCEDYVVSLTRTEANDIGFVRKSRNEVGSDDLEGMVIDGEVEEGVDRWIDKSKAVRFV